MLARPPPILAQLLASHLSAEACRKQELELKLVAAAAYNAVAATAAASTMASMHLQSLLDQLTRYAAKGSLERDPFLQAVLQDELVHAQQSVHLLRQQQLLAMERAGAAREAGAQMREQREKEEEERQAQLARLLLSWS